jgi:hypothetical protein
MAQQKKRGLANASKKTREEVARKGGKARQSQRQSQSTDNQSMM